MNRPVIDVDENGRDADGLDARMIADDSVIRAGLMVNAPVTFRYPDGRLEHATQARFTLKGLAFLRGSRIVN